MNELHDLTTSLVTRSWRVFLEADADVSRDSPVCFWAGLSQEHGIGTEGIAYCDFVEKGNTFLDALRGAMRKAGID